MSKYLKLFNNHSEYAAFLQSEDFIKPNVSHCVQENDVHYNPWTDPRLIIKYNVTDATQPTLLYNYYDDEEIHLTGAVMFDKVEIDGVEVSIQDLDTAEGKYDFTVGEHTVKYTLKDPTKIGIIIDEQTGEQQVYATFAGCSNITDITIPDSVTTIGNYAFFVDSFDVPYIIENVNIGSGLTDIEPYSFSLIKNLTINTPVVNDWFRYQTSLETITLGGNVQTIVDGAFCACIGVNDIDKANVENINENAFCESYCIMATFPQSTQKAYLGNGFAYYIDGVKIPDNEIIREYKS